MQNGFGEAHVRVHRYPILYFVIPTEDFSPTEGPVVQPFSKLFWHAENISIENRCFDCTPSKLLVKPGMCHDLSHHQQRVVRY